MKKLLIAAGTVITCFALQYFLFAFFFWELSAQNWGQSVRAYYLFMSGVSSVWAVNSIYAGLK